jgi:hypothetical protein
VSLKGPGGKTYLSRSVEGHSLGSSCKRHHAWQELASHVHRAPPHKCNDYMPVESVASTGWWSGPYGSADARSLCPERPRRPTVSNNYFMTILEEAARYSFSVSIKISYPVPSKSATLRILSVCLTHRRTRAAAEAKSGDGDASDAESEAEAVEVAVRDRLVLDTATMEVTLPAFMLVRDSGFFRAALTNGFKETHSREIDCEAADAEGGSRVCAQSGRHQAPANDSLLPWQRRMTSCSSSRFFARARATWSMTASLWSGLSWCGCWCWGPSLTPNTLWRSV